MNDPQYLWDKSGPVDMEIAALERTLSPLRYKAPRRKRKLPLLGAGAVAAAAALLFWIYLPGPVSSWSVALTDGAEKPLRMGQQVTARAEEMHLRATQVGYLRLEPNSRLRVLGAGNDTERVALEYGAVRAVIWAPPARFGVELPAATAVDLGCIYRLETNRDGDGQLSVETGWVALQNKDVESFIPAGASCRIDRRKGPGLPVYDDAPEAFRDGALAPEGKGEIEKMLQLARPKDALTLWHLLQRTHGPVRARVAARYASLVPLPEGLSATELAEADPETMDAAWNALRLGSTNWWRTWKQHWF